MKREKLMKGFVPVDIPTKPYIKAYVIKKLGLKILNLYIEKEIKYHFYNMMDDFIEILPSFRNNLPEVRRRLGVNESVWCEDSMRKDYYRRCKRAGKKMFRSYL